MAKIINFQQVLSEINFLSPQNEFSLYWQSFLESELGGIYQSIPWKELAKSFGLKRKPKGRKTLFTPQGKLALMILKAYTGVSDRKLIQQLNANLHYQFFCGILLRPDQKLKDYKIVSKIRSSLANNLNIKDSQKILAQHWKPYLDQTHVMLTDATCYESQLRYPTNVKLLWESVDWIYHQITKTSKALKVRRPRNRYHEQKEKYDSYQRMRRKPKKNTNARVRSLLYLLNKLNEQLDEIEEKHADCLSFPQKYYEKREVIRKVQAQQLQIFETGKSLPDRIVSISKSYIRPIVRGKEIKKVEFGAKVNMIQIDGINFIEHINFNPFHEGIRLISSIWLSESLFGRTTHVSGDQIYATNQNRKYCTSRNITTSFTRKGRPGKHEPQRKMMSSILAKERATRMEGSFGTEKEHYSLEKIKAKTIENEKLWIFFGVHTANAVRMVKKIQKKSLALSA